MLLETVNKGEVFVFRERLSLFLTIGLFGNSITMFVVLCILNANAEQEIHV